MIKKPFLTTALSLILSVCSTGGIASAGQNQLQRILLSDKTVIIGQVIAMQNGIYTIKSDAVGELKISADKIVAISSLNQPVERPLQPVKEIAIRDGAHSQRQNAESVSNASSGSETSKNVRETPAGRQQEEVNSQVQSMAMNGDFLNSMLKLSESSDMSDIMQDPEIMDAISRNDYDFLMNSEKMKSLMDNQEIKDLLGDVQP